MGQYRHPALVGLDNRGYRDTQIRHAAYQRGWKIGESGQATAASQVGQAFERILYAGLEQTFTLSEKRILAYEEEDKGRYLKKYRELDAVTVARGLVTAVFEVKASRTEQAALRGKRQLRTTWTILRSGTLGVGGVALVLIWVDTGGDPVQQNKWMPVESPDDLSKVDSALEPGKIYFIRISAQDAWAWRSRLGVGVQYGLWESYEAEAANEVRQRELTGAAEILSDGASRPDADDSTSTRWQTRDESGEERSTMAAAFLDARKGRVR